MSKFDICVEESAREGGLGASWRRHPVAPEAARSPPNVSPARIHLDIKKLGRFDKPGHVTGDRKGQSSAGKTWGAGWEYVHVCIDDASRIACSQVMPNEKKESAIAALKAALAYYKV
jgi:hypothetical protein